MPDFTTGKAIPPARVSGRLRRRLPYRRGSAGRERTRVRIPQTPGGQPPPQSPPTRTGELTGPSGGRGEIVFETYTPLADPENPGLFALAPPDMSGAESPLGVVLYTGNTYLVASKDGGASFADLDTTTFLPAIPGRAVDQVITYIPEQRYFAWMMQHGTSPGSGDGNLRLAIARTDDLMSDFITPWLIYDFTSAAFGFPGVATDRQDITFTDQFLYMTTGIVGEGRIIIRIPLAELGGAVTPQFTEPLDRIFAFSNLSQQNGDTAHTAAIVDDTTLRVVSCRDSSSAYDVHEVAVGKFPVATDLASVDPDGVDWLTRGVANVCAVLSHGADLWIAWDAAASAPGESPSYPHAHLRIATVDTATWTVSAEQQVWNPDYAFAYGTLAANHQGAIGYGVAVGGPSDYPNTCFGILGDFVVYYRDTSDITAQGSGEARWGDYITVRPSPIDLGKFGGFGYFTKRVPSGGYFQTPYYLRYGRP